jgi:hypothetical protein
MRRGLQDADDAGAMQVVNIKAASKKHFISITFDLIPGETPRYFFVVLRCMI